MGLDLLQSKQLSELSQIRRGRQELGHIAKSNAAPGADGYGLVALAL
jgi:hypothetical protein